MSKTVITRWALNVTRGCGAQTEYIGASEKEVFRQLEKDGDGGVEISYTRAFPVKISSDGEIIEIDGMPIAEYLEECDDERRSIKYAEWQMLQDADDSAFCVARGWLS